MRWLWQITGPTEQRIVGECESKPGARKPRPRNPERGTRLQMSVGLLLSALISLGCGTTLRTDGAEANADRTGPSDTPSTPIPESAKPKSDLASCAARATTRIATQLNLDASQEPHATRFDPTDPANTSNLQSLFSVFDALGREGTLSLCFGATDAGWDYHAVLEDGLGLSGGVEVAAGNLEFSAGALQHQRVIQPLRLPLPNGSLDPEIALDLGTPLDAGGSGLDGVQSFPSENMLWGLDVDGNRASVGRACARSADPPAAADGTEPQGSQSEVPSCAPRATTRLTIRANLRAQSALVAGWDPWRPEQTSNFRTQLWLADDHGRRAEIELYFSRTNVAEWSYHLLLVGDTSAIELGSGKLEFNANGSLRRVLTIEPLRFPNPEGAWNEPVELDFGQTAESGGPGVDGVTSFGTGSVLLAAETDGRLGTFGCDCARSSGQIASPFQGIPGQFQDGWFLPLCTGLFSTEITALGNLSAATPLTTVAWSADAPEATSSLRASTEIYDALANPVAASIYYRRLSQSGWEYRLLVGAAGEARELAAGRLGFDANGLLREQEGVTAFRLPLADGTPGPTVRLNFQIPQNPWESWSSPFSSPDFNSAPELFVDGIAPRHGVVCIDG